MTRMITRRTLLASAAALPSLGLAPAFGATFPERPITIVLPVAAGGLIDALARMAAQRVSTALRQPVVVDNRPGANTMVATEYVAKAKPDGHTLLLTFQSLIINPLLYKDGRVRYDPFKDFLPVSRIGGNINSYLAIAPDRPVETLADLVKYAKSRPDPIAYASVGVGNPGHFYCERVAKATGMKMTLIPYKGESAMLPDLFAGRVDAAFISAVAAYQYNDPSKLRLVGCSGKKRSARLPKVPTFGEQGVEGVDVDAWYGVFAPSGTPAPIVELLSAEFQKAVDADREQIASYGMDPIGGTPADFARIVRTTHNEWTQMIKAVPIQLE